MRPSVLARTRNVMFGSGCFPRTCAIVEAKLRSRVSCRSTRAKPSQAKSKQKMMHLSQESATCAQPLMCVGSYFLTLHGSTHTIHKNTYLYHHRKGSRARGTKTRRHVPGIVSNQDGAFLFYLKTFQGPSKRFGGGGYELFSTHKGGYHVLFIGRRNGGDVRGNAW